jgi:hypothetical protein
MSDEYADLKQRVDKLETELAEAKKALEAVKPKELFVSRFEMPQYDPTENMRMPPSAVKPMADLIHGKGGKYDKDAWARTRLSQPSGFGPPAEPSGARAPEVQRGSGWRDPAPLEPQIKGWWSK